MAENSQRLTAEDVHYKRFTPTKFREGYDQDEVDVFLDQVVKTIVELETELQDAQSGAPVSGGDDAQLGKLRQELAGAQSRIAQLEAQLAEAQSNLAAQEGELAKRDSEISQLKAQANAAPAAAVSQPETQPTAAPQQDATSMLALAQRVHDEYVRNGEEEGQRIIAEARAQGDQIVQEARDENRRVRDQLETERAALQEKVDGLKRFESDYRGQLRQHLEQLLQQVEKAS
ncbi:MAG: DivIVA domain-containing protein [Varibaculum sp.]|nr:DivIVA domain-containing protein [Varibaculum sp.]